MKARCADFVACRAGVARCKYCPERGPNRGHKMAWGASYALAHSHFRLRRWVGLGWAGLARAQALTHFFFVMLAPEHVSGDVRAPHLNADLLRQLERAQVHCLSSEFIIDFLILPQLPDFKVGPCPVLSLPAAIPKPQRRSHAPPSAFSIVRPAPRPTRGTTRIEPIRIFDITDTEGARAREAFYISCAHGDYGCPPQSLPVRSLPQLPLLPLPLVVCSSAGVIAAKSHALPRVPRRTTKTAATTPTPTPAATPTDAADISTPILKKCAIASFTDFSRSHAAAKRERASRKGSRLRICTSKRAKHANQRI